MAISLDSILDDIFAMEIEEQIMVSEILQKRIIEEKRNQIYSDYLSAMDEKSNGTIKTGSVKDLFKSI